MSYDVIFTSDDKDIHEGRMNMTIMPRLMRIQQDNVYFSEIYIPEIMMHPPEFKIWIIMKDMRSEYSYTYEIDYWPGPNKMNDIRQWIEDMKIPCTQVNRAFFFKTEEDRLLFILRWP